MRSCCAVYVDVGYLLAAVATRVTGSSLRRGVQTDYAVLIEALQAQAEADSGLPLLRVNWYDAGGRPGGMPDLSQDEIGLLPRVKLRLGRLSYSGEQKGVDVRIGLDLAIQARQRVADVVYLVSGDDDLTEAVEEAQGQGVQVVLLVVPRHDGRPLAVAKHLAREVDRTIVIDPAAIDAAVRSRAVPEALVPDALFDVDADGVDAGGVGDGVGSVAVGGVRSTEAQPNEEQVECAPGAGAPGLGELPRGRRRVTRLAHRFDAGSPDGAAQAMHSEPSHPHPSHEQPVPSQLSHEQPPPPHRETVAEPAGQPAPSRPVPGPPGRVPAAGATPAAQADADGSAASESGAAHASSPPGPTQRVAGTHQAAGPAARTEGASAPQLAAQGAGPQTPGPGQTGSASVGPATSPSPALFARRKAARLVLPGARAAPAEAASVAAHEGLTIALVDAVARQVVASWCSSATPDALADLTRGAPTIPAELDRALLVDLSSRAEGGDLDDRDRHDVRARFWYYVGRVRPI